MATTVLTLGKSGSAVRPYGYEAKAQLDGTTTSVVFGIPSDVYLIGVSVSLAEAGSFWLEGTKSAFADIVADAGVFVDLVGDGVTEQSVTTIGDFLGGFSAIRVRRVSGSPLVEMTARRA